MLQPNHRDQGSAVEHLADVGGDGAGEADEAQGFGDEDHERGGGEATPEISQSADDDDGEDENGFVVKLVGSMNET